ncbi:hypothetical protein AAG570_010513, partial [Ranatra chinensis]
GAILGTFHEKCAETFWTCVLRLPLQENRIVAWKFCHVLHKILREGHPQAITDSYRHMSNIDELGKLWGHLREGYGKLIQLYCSLLICKLKFHRRNPRIPGNLSLTSDELDSIGENDMNIYFQLAVEMFDYMDEILTLQGAIFGSLDMSRSNSMTSCGQCRLAPLIPVIQDSSKLYDTCVKILFHLHASLPPDALSGHRDRFLKQFKVLRQFYIASSALQYFKNLIHIPALPENPPNFLIQSELRSYVPPVVVLPPEEPPDLPDTSSIGELVDLASPPPSNGTTSPDLITERDSLIEHLQNELSRYRAEKNKLFATVSHLNSLNEQLKAQNSNLEEELAKKKADVDKQLANVKDVNEASEKMRLEQLAQELAALQSSADAAAEQNQVLESKLEILTEENSRVKNEIQDLRFIKDDLDVRLQMERKETNDVKESQKQLFERILGEAENIVQQAIHEVDNPSLSSATCSLDYFTSLVDPLNVSMGEIEQNPGAEQIIRLAHLTAKFVIHGKETSNTATDIEFGERFGEMCKKVGECCIEGFQSIRAEKDVALISMRENMSILLEMTSSLEKLLQSNKESIGDLIERELATMDKAIEEASKKIEEMLNQSRATDSGVKLEVNEKILDSCTGLMQAIRILVQKSRILQAEVVAKGKGSASVKEFYKRNHQWTEGLISAAKEIGLGAKNLLDAADKVVTSDGKIEFVIVAAQDISASTAQLVVASRVKADRNSQSLTDLTEASRGVTQATATVVTSSKACVQLVEQSEDLDLSGMSLHNAKRQEMESQVRTLELECLLDKERKRLAALRKHHYSLAPESDQLPPA